MFPGGRPRQLDRSSTETVEHVRGPVAPDAGDNAKLGQMGADRVDQPRAMAHQQLTGPVQHLHRLLLRRLHRHAARTRSTRIEAIGKLSNEHYDWSINLAPD